MMNEKLLKMIVIVLPVFTDNNTFRFSITAFKFHVDKSSELFCIPGIVNEYMYLELIS